LLHNPLAIIFFLLCIEIFVLKISSHPRFKKYFDFLPPVFWIYFLPMLASTFGLIDAKAPIYQVITTYILPASLFILLVTVDVKAILRLGPTAIVMFLAGSVGIMLGTAIVFNIFKPWIGQEFWAGFGCLAGSWTGGSANMIAVKEALQTPDHVFTPMVIVDTIVPYVWMGTLMAVVGLKPWFDKWNKTDQKILIHLNSKAGSNKEFKGKISLKYFLMIVSLGAAASLFSQEVAKCLPIIKDVISTYAWAIIVVTALGICLSFTKLKKIQSHGSNTIGYFLLYFVLTTIGAKASLSNLHSAVLLILAGFLIVLFHAVVLIIAARLMRAPMFLVVTASQANVGGVASAPVVAEVYQSGLGAIGLLLAIFGNILGTYFGILTAQLCRLFS
jgi:uncharacterized membrane protein